MKVKWRAAGTVLALVLALVMLPTIALADPVGSLSIDQSSQEVGRVGSVSVGYNDTDVDAVELVFPGGFLIEGPASNGSSVIDGQKITITGCSFPLTIPIKNPTTTDQSLGLPGSVGFRQVETRVRYTVDSNWYAWGSWNLYVNLGGPAVPQGVQGVVKDASTGVAIPFARVQIRVGSGEWTFIQAGYDGTYSCGAPASDDISMGAWANDRDSQSVYPVVVAEGAVTTQDFSLDRYDDFDQPVYRFFNMKGGVHFYTADDGEFMNTYKNLSGVFHYDGIAYYVPWGTSEDPDYTNPNTMPLYRFFNRQTGVHFYTMSEAEKNTVQTTLAHMYTYEGIAYYVTDNPVDTLPVLRFYVPLRNAHFFTADNTEIPMKSGLSNYYHYEGIGFYIGHWIYNPIEQ